MKTNHQQLKSARGWRGSAVLIVLALVGIIAIVVGSSFVAAHTLQGQVKALEKRQLKRLEVPVAQPAASPAEKQAGG